jgi:DNA-binding FrmR family transcriptional regulator
VDSHQRAVLNRLKTARGHINGIIAIVEDDAYCPDVMKQLSAVQGLLEGASRVMLRRHLESCVAKAMQEGRTAEIVDELMETLKFDKQVFRTPPPSVSDALLGAVESRTEIAGTGETL